MSSFGPSKYGGGMKSVDRPSRGTGRAVAADLSAARPKPKLKKVLPEVWKLIKPRRVLLGGSFLLMVINRASGLILPASTKYLIDNVMGKHQLACLLPHHRLASVRRARTIIQGITSYTLTQLLSKEGQRLIAELRMKVQEHIGRLPVAFYDENRTGTLVARIMTDVEGVRNLIGTGVIDFVGGVLTAIFAFGYLIHLSVQMTLVTFVILLRLRSHPAARLQDHPAHLPRARQDQRRGHRPPHRIARRRPRRQGLPRRGQRGQCLRRRCQSPAAERHLLRSPRSR